MADDARDNDDCSSSARSSSGDDDEEQRSGGGSASSSSSDDEEEEEEEETAFGMVRTRRFLPMLLGSADLLSPRAALDRLRELTPRPGCVRRAVDGAEETAAVHYKFAPMLDPHYLLLGRYDVADDVALPSLGFRAYVSRHQKIMDPMNSAAMDALGAHLSGELFRQGLLTAVESFGYSVGIKRHFRFDVGTECMALCNDWDTRKNRRHRFAWSRKPADYAERKADLRDQKREGVDNHDNNNNINNNKHDDAADYGGAAAEGDDWWSYNPGEATVDLYDMPVVLVAMEFCAGGTLEDLLVARQAAGAAPFSDAETAALVMQLLFTLAAFQHRFGFVHGDLHLRNVVIAPTDLPELRFAFGGVNYAVPTFGRIYKLVDFGRSSFQIDGRAFVSDAFMPYGDGDGMYNCGAGRDLRRRQVSPSRSLDLGLLSGPLFARLAACDAPSAAAAAAAAPATAAVYEWGLMRAPAEDWTPAPPPCDAALAAELAAAEREEDEDDAGGVELDEFDPALAGKHACFSPDGTFRFGKDDLRTNQVVARYVRDATPADLLQRYLRPETRSYVVAPAAHHI